MGTHEVSDDWKNARGASPERASQHYALRPLPSNCAPGWKLNGARLLPGFCERPQEENEQTTGPCCAKGGVDDSPSMYGATRCPSSVGKSSEFVDTARTQRTAHRGRRESAKRKKSVRSADTRNLPIYVLCCSGPEGRKHAWGWEENPSWVWDARAEPHVRAGLAHFFAGAAVGLALLHLEDRLSNEQ